MKPNDISERDGKRDLKGTFLKGQAAGYRIFGEAVCEESYGIRASESVGKKSKPESEAKAV